MEYEEDESTQCTRHSQSGLVQLNNVAYLNICHKKKNTIEQQVSSNDLSVGKGL